MNRASMRRTSLFFACLLAGCQQAATPGAAAPYRDGAAASGLEQPVYFWTPSIAPSGMSFYRGRLFPEWRNSLFVHTRDGSRAMRWAGAFWLAGTLTATLGFGYHYGADLLAAVGLGARACSSGQAALVAVAEFLPGVCLIGP